MKALREAAEKKDGLRAAWTDSVQSAITLMSSTFSRLTWNNQPIQVT